jgi:phage terminase small subunit
MPPDLDLHTPQVQVPTCPAKLRHVLPCATDASRPCPIGAVYRRRSLAMAKPGELTVKQAKFVQAYAHTGNGARSAVEAGYSAKAAKEIASRLLTNANVCAAIRARQAEAARSSGVTIQRIIEEFAKLAFTNLDELVSWDRGHLTLKASAELTPAQAAAVIEVAETESKSGRPLLKIKLYSKQPALESLLKCLAAIDLEDRVKALEDAIQHGRNGYGGRP